MIRRPEFHQLETFLKVVETRSFAGAARLLGRTQPAVSQAIARLEDIFGGDLFVRRHGAALALTPIGEAILPSARALLYTADQQMSEAIATAQGRTGQLAVGFFSGLTSGPLRSAIANFCRTSPEVRLRLVEGLPGELHRRLNERDIDLMIVALMPLLHGGGLAQETLWHERLHVALPVSHRLARQERMHWSDVATLPLILRTWMGEMGVHRALFARSGGPLACEQHDVSRETLLIMVGMGLGATLVFESAIAPHPGVAFRPILDESARIAIEAVWSKDDRHPLRHRLLNQLRAHAGDPLPAGVSRLFPTRHPSGDHGLQARARARRAGR